MEHWWDDTDGAKLKYEQKNICQHHFVNHKPHVAWHGIKPNPPRWEDNK
jgi:hypothetical protein